VHPQRCPARDFAKSTSDRLGEAALQNAANDERRLGAENGVMKAGTILDTSINTSRRFDQMGDAYPTCELLVHLV
jgi:hypothetical protein